MAETTPESLGLFLVRIYTAARRVRPIVGKVNGYVLPYGPFHVAQIIALIAPVALSYLIARTFQLPLFNTVGVALVLGISAALALTPLARQGRVPLLHQLYRDTKLILFRRPLIVGEPADIRRARDRYRRASNGPQL